MADPLHTRLCELLGVRHPVVQTGMGWVGVPELAGTVSAAGGLGFIAAATMTTAELEGAIGRVRELTDRPFGVNFVMEQPNAAEVADAVVHHGVRVVGYNRSPRRDLVDRFKEAGVVCMPTVGAPRHATKAVELGADALIVQGGEGGGHTGSVPTSLLVPQVVDAVGVPVAAAGGLKDGRGLVAALAFGAHGVAMGTRFLLTRESPVAPEAVRRYLEASVTDTVVTRRVDGLPQRLVRTDFTDRLEHGNPVTGFLRALRSAYAYRQLSGTSFWELLKAGLSLRSSEKLTRTQLILAANAPVLVRRGLLEGRADEGILPTGQVAGAIDDVPGAAEVVERVVAEARATLERLSGGR